MRGWCHELRRQTTLTTQLADQLDFHWTQPAAAPARRPDRRRVLLGAGAGLLDRASRRRASTSRTRSPSRRRSPRSRGGSRTSSSACWRCATTRTSAGRPPTTRAGSTPPTPRPRCASSTTPTRIGSRASARLNDDDLDRPCGPAEGPYAEYPFIDADPAHQPRSDPPRRRNRLHPRPLRAQPRQEGEA